MKNRALKICRMMVAVGMLGAVPAAPALAAGNGNCASCGLSDASRALGGGSGLVVAGAMATIAASGLLIVDGVQAAGDGSVVLLKSASDGAKVSIRVSAEIAEQFSGAVGESVRVVATSTGHLLVASGKAIAFIPNELGLALLHQTKLN